MGAKAFRDLDDFQRHGCSAIIAVCTGCGREVAFETQPLVAHFRRRGLTTTLPWAGRYFICRGRADILGCGHRGATLKPGDWDGPSGPPAPRAERVPLGVDRDAWAKADDRERKRLIRKARG